MLCTDSAYFLDNIQIYRIKTGRFEHVGERLMNVFFKTLLDYHVMSSRNSIIKDLYVFKDTSKKYPWVDCMCSMKVFSAVVQYPVRNLVTY